MTDSEMIVHEAARQIAACIARRLAAGKRALPPWRAKKRKIRRAA